MLGYGEYMGAERWWKVDPMGHFLAWYDERVSGTKRPDVEEGDAFWIFPDKAGGNVSSDNLAENRWHYDSPFADRRNGSLPGLLGVRSGGSLDRFRTAFPCL